MMITLTATVIEIAPQDGFSIMRFQLAGTDGTATTGDTFNVAIEDTSGYEVGQIIELTL
jgi:hypothetical protein